MPGGVRAPGNLPARSTQFAEEGSHLLSQQFRLLKGCKMPAFFHHAPAADVLVYPLRRDARGLEDFARELGVAGGNRDGVPGWQNDRAMEPRVVRPERR